MLFIKHRVNTGKAKESIEVDVHYFKDKLWLGHDEPEKLMPEPLLHNTNVWFHAKDVSAYKRLLVAKTMRPVKCFVHAAESIAPVNGGFFWTMHPELVDEKTVFMDVRGRHYLPFETALILGAYGICSDNIEVWRDLYNGHR